MARIYYQPLHASELISGLPITKSSLASVVRLAQTDRWLDANYSPPLFVGTYHQGDAGTGVGATTNAGSGSPDTLGRWIIQGNTARRKVIVTMIALVTGSTTGTLTVTHGGASASATLTSTTAIGVEVGVTPTTGSAPLELTITGHTTNSLHVVLLCASARFEDDDNPASGARADGYYSMGFEGLYASGSAAENWPQSPTTDGFPVSTELMARAYNNARALARDRVACLASYNAPHNTETSRKDWNTNGSTRHLAASLVVPQSELIARSGKLSFYVFTNGDPVTHDAIVNGTSVGSATISSSAWVHHTITLPVKACLVELYVKRNSGTGYVGVTSAQVWRSV